MNTESSKQYSWSTDEEQFHGQFDSEEAAIADALCISGHDFEVGNVIWIGEAVPVLAEELVRAESVIDQMLETAYELAGEASEDYLSGVTAEQKKELESLIAAWADGVENPSFWQITNTTEYTITAEDLEPSDG